MVGYIYLITDTTNDKKYVGQHHYDREELDPTYHGSGKIISKIYKKRPETLKEEYLKTCFTQTEMNEWEKYFIYTNNTLYPNGYNLTEGGDGGVPCDETRKKISESNKGKHHSEEARKKMSEARRGEKHRMFGQHHSEESKRKISESLKGKISPRKGVILSEETRKKISDSNKGKKGTFTGKCHSEESKRKMSDSKKGQIAWNKGKHHSEETIRKLSKPVLQFTLDGEFVREWPSTKECGRNGFDFGTVARCCRGEEKTHKGFIWKYKKES